VQARSWQSALEALASCEQSTFAVQTPFAQKPLVQSALVKHLLLSFALFGVSGVHAATRAKHTVIQKFVVRILV
jgi:cytochrome b561